MAQSDALAFAVAAVRAYLASPEGQADPAAARFRAAIGEMGNAPRAFRDRIEVILDIPKRDD